MWGFASPIDIDFQIDCLAIFMVFFSCLLWPPSSKSLFSFSSSLLVSILSSQADPPTLKNLAGARFSKNQGLGSKDALDGVLGLPLAHFGCAWRLWGALLVPLRAFGGTLNSQNFCLRSLPCQIDCFFCLFFRSLLRSRCFPSLRTSWCRF